MNKEISRTQLTVTKSPNELLLLPVKINGFGPYTFILDAGASCCCITPELAKELKIKKCKKSPASGPGGSFTAHDGVASTISIGRAVRRNVDVSIFDFDMLRKFDESINGIIGHNFLSRYTIVINYEKNELLLYK